MSKNKQMTDWFDIDVKPAYVGVYQVKPWVWGNDISLSKWDGKKWCEVRANVPDAEEQTKKSWNMYHNAKPKWRGFKHEQTV